MPRRTHTEKTSTAKTSSRAARPTEPAIADLAIESVVSYPDQAAVYGDVPAATMDVLRRSMETDGQREPIHVVPAGNAAELPAFTVVDGHQRVAAAGELGWSTIRAVVRWDLVNTSREEIHRLFLRLNFERRQLSPMAQSLVLVAIHESMTGRRRESFTNDDWHDVCASIEAHLGIKHRNAQRYVHVARTPPVVHDAFREGYLTLVLAAKIDGLLPDDQQTLAAEITDVIVAIREAESAGDKANARRLRQVLRRLVRSRVGEQHAADRTHVSTFRRLTEAIHRLLPGMPNVITQINSEVTRDNLPDLRAMRDVLDKLIRRAGQNRRSR